MKIVLAIHHFLPNYTAGAEVYTFGLASWLIRHGHTVDVVCIESINFRGQADIEHRHETYEGISVWRLYYDHKRAANVFRQSYDNPLIGKWFTEFLRQTRPDLVHFHSGYLMSASIVAATKQLGLPLVVTLHDFWFVCPRITLLKPTGALCRVPPDAAECAWCLAMEKRRFRWPELASRGAARAFALRLLAMPGGAQVLGLRPDSGEMARRRQVLIQALRQADVILSPSEFLRSIFVEQGIDPSRIVYSRLGLDTSQWSLSAGSAKEVSEVLRLAYIGQLSHHKGVHLLVKAFHRLDVSKRPAQLKIYGSPTAFPDYARSLVKMADRNGGIEFGGRFDNRRVADILQQTDAIVVPSLWYENSPVTIMEALTAGTPVVASELGGIPELVQHDVNGLLFEVGDVADLARQLQRLLDEPGLVAHLAAQARPVRMINDELQQIVSLYEQVGHVTP